MGVGALWILPIALTAPASAGLTAGERLQAANDVRGTLVAFIVGLGGAVTVWFAARSYLLNREGHVTDRYTAAVAQLGHDSIYVRIGGIYALERIGRDSLKDRTTVIYVLGAFAREESKVPRPIPEDVRTALRVAGRLLRGTDIMLNLRGADLRQTDISFLPKEQLQLGGALLDDAGAPTAGDDEASAR